MAKSAWQQIGRLKLAGLVGGQHDDAHVLQLSLGKGSLSLLPVKIFDKPARLELANESIIDNRIDFDRFRF